MIEASALSTSYRRVESAAGPLPKEGAQHAVLLHHGAVPDQRHSERPPFGFGAAIAAAPPLGLDEGDESVYPRLRHRVPGQRCAREEFSDAMETTTRFGRDGLDDAHETE